MNTRERWYDTYRMHRVALQIEDGGRYTSPRWDDALSTVFNGHDRLEHKRPGAILGLMRQKQRVIASGGYWMGFGFRRPTYNCRCVVLPITELPAAER